MFMWTKEVKSIKRSTCKDLKSLVSWQEKLNQKTNGIPVHTATTKSGDSGKYS